jgi:Protein of unknown function (DUF4229)
VKAFVLYTAARLLLFALTWAAVAGIASIWLDWDSVTALWTALIALALSAVLSLVLLRSLRDQLATSVAERAAKTRRSFDEARSREDDDG